MASVVMVAQMMVTKYSWLLSSSKTLPVRTLNQEPLQHIEKDQNYIGII